MGCDGEGEPKRFATTGGVPVGLGPTRVWYFAVIGDGKGKLVIGFPIGAATGKSGLSLKSPVNHESAEASRCFSERSSSLEACKNRKVSIVLERDSKSVEQAQLVLTVRLVAKVCTSSFRLSSERQLPSHFEVPAEEIGLRIPSDHC